MGLVIVTVLTFLVLVLPFILFNWWQNERPRIEETFAVLGGGVDLLRQGCWRGNSEERGQCQCTTHFKWVA